MGSLQELTMPLIMLIAALCLLRYLEIWFFADLSWWWIVGLMLCAVVWFECIEKLLGLDQSKAHDEDEKRRQRRIKQSFKKPR
jgi:small Trp-rich protein